MEVGELLVNVADASQDAEMQHGTDRVLPPPPHCPNATHAGGEGTTTHGAFGGHVGCVARWWCNRTKVLRPNIPAETSHQADTGPAAVHVLLWAVKHNPPFSLVMGNAQLSHLG